MYTAILLILSITPVSYLLIELLDRTAFKKNRELSKVKTILTPTSKILIKKYQTVKTLFFDNSLIKIKENSSLSKIGNKKQLPLLAAIAHLCTYPKTAKLESTISNFFDKCRLNKTNINKKYIVFDDIKNRENKKLSTVIAKHTDSKEIFAFSKGNPYAILDICSRSLENDKKEVLTPQKKRHIKKQIEKLNKKGQKVIAYAVRPLPLKKLDHYSEEFTEKELIFLGLIAVAKPINREIKKDIRKAKEQNLKIYLISQVKERNAIAIAKELKIINHKFFESITGTYLKSLSDKKLEKKLSNREKDFIFSELKKDQKKRIKKTLKKLGHPSVFVDKKNNFKKIIEGIKKRTQINKNRPKIFIHALSCKLPLLLIILLSLFLKIPSPVSLSLILILDLIVNLSLELSLRAEKTQAPSKNLSTEILIHTLLPTVMILFLFIYNLFRLGWTPGDTFNSLASINQNSTTLIFVILTIFQIIKAYQISSSKLFKKSRNLFLLSTTIISLLVLYMAVNYLSNPPSYLELNIILILSIIFFTIPLLFKLTFQHENSQG